LAIDNFKQSYQYAKKVNASSLEGFALKGLAQVYTLEGKFSEAIPILENALLISSKVNDLILNQELYKGLSENYLALNQWDNFNILKIIMTINNIILTSSYPTKIFSSQLAHRI
jgi:tetratricopeptide (TPR) repeat protein